jgi:hypothetical protein
VVVGVTVGVRVTVGVIFAVGVIGLYRSKAFLWDAAQRANEIHADHRIRVISAGLPTDVDMHHWTLDLKHYSLHLISQPLRSSLGNLQLASCRFTEMLCSQ